MKRFQKKIGGEFLALIPRKWKRNLFSIGFIDFIKLSDLFAFFITFSNKTNVKSIVDESKPNATTSSRFSWFRWRRTAATENSTETIERVVDFSDPSDMSTDYLNIARSIAQEKKAHNSETKTNHRQTLRMTSEQIVRSFFRFSKNFFSYFFGEIFFSISECKIINFFSAIFFWKTTEKPKFEAGQEWSGIQCWCQSM